MGSRRSNSRIKSAHIKRNVKSKAVASANEQFRLLMHLHRQHFPECSFNDFVPSLPSLASFVRVFGGFHSPFSCLSTNKLHNILLQLEDDHSSPVSFQAFLDILLPSLYPTSLYAKKHPSTSNKQPPPPSPTFDFQNLLTDYLYPLASSKKSAISSSSSSSYSSPLNFSQPQIIGSLLFHSKTFESLFNHYSRERFVDVDPLSLYVTKVRSVSKVQFLNFLVDSNASANVDQIHFQNSNNHVQHCLDLFDKMVVFCDSHIPISQNHLVPQASLPPNPRTNKHNSSQIQTQTQPQPPPPLRYINYSTFAELLITISSVSNNIDSNSSIQHAVTTLVEQISENQFVHTCNVYAKCVQFPLLTRFLALLQDAQILDSRLDYHAAASIFTRQCSERKANVDVLSNAAADSILSVDLFGEVLLSCLPVLGSVSAVSPSESGKASVKVVKAIEVSSTLSPANHSLNQLNSTQLTPPKLERLLHTSSGQLHTPVPNFPALQLQRPGVFLHLLSDPTKVRLYALLEQLG